MESQKSVLVKDSRGLTDFFKGIAILLVILVHSRVYFDLSFAQSAVQRFGQMGCQIFFVLSSYGLCHSFYKRIPTWFAHMKKRISKLAVGFWGAILIHVIYRIITAVISGGNILAAIDVPGVIINAFFLNGFVPFGGINNVVVRGGWYVGTTVILYAIFPLLFKFYFSDKIKVWQKYRFAIFPLVVFLATSVVVVIAGFVHPVFLCSNNSFVYFSFVNQLTPFALGIVLFDISRRFNSSKLFPCFSLVLLMISAILFYGEYKYSFVFCPSFVAASFVFFYLYILNNKMTYNGINENKNVIVRIISRFGKISFSIYLIHSFIVYDFSILCLRFLRPVYNNDFLWYLILLPIEYCLIYVLGSIYNKCVSRIEKTRET